MPNHVSDITISFRTVGINWRDVTMYSPGYNRVVKADD